LQTVYKQTNPAYHRLIERFGELTGVPVIMNTSFNLKGEPIVESPAHAFNTFSLSGDGPPVPEQLRDRSVGQEEDRRDGLPPAPRG
jgi:hypothetical protein